MLNLNTNFKIKNMKKFNLLFLSLFALATITSCNNDDDDNSSASIEGKWQISLEGETLATLVAAENEGSCGFDITEFSQAGTYKVTDFYSTGSACTSETETGTWIKKDNTLTIKNGDNETIVLQILELSDSTLKIKSTDAEGDWIEVYIKK